MMYPTDIAGTVQVMLAQERSTYQRSDYLKLVSHLEGEVVNMECREKMTEWSYQVVEFCNFSRETVDIGMSYLDRFLNTEVGSECLQCRKQFQLVAMCCLCLAIKLFESKEMELSFLSELSRGCYSVSEISKTEKTILNVLEWRMNPPTASSFVQHFVESYFASISHTEDLTQLISALNHISTKEVEYAVGKYSLMTTNPSNIAIASIGNALELINSRHISRSSMMSHIEFLCGTQLNTDEITDTQKLLLPCLTDISEYREDDTTMKSSLEYEAYESQQHSPVSTARQTQTM
eukprot:CAMPEP_0178943724 /NCGR_PEP_ID=MMETSP0789-20121207/2747_1 /TAXON_ID=3005 /ORGANISM="Rhizosolenia setigera, Strain CCMP 1694" /LENGTH=291 /DNA_ID=CAMNT_0020623353 /DNA_START=28 /DNA_END=903 /DNA_ORIENTATION=-